MIDLIRETLSLHNLPVTLLLGLVVFYWLLVIVGFVDLDVDVDAGGGDGDFGGGKDAPAHWNANGSAAGGALAVKGRRWLSFGAVPINVVGTVLAIFMWVFSVIGNFYLNGEPWNRSTDVALLLLIPNFLLSLVLTRIAIIPFDKFFTALQQTNQEDTKVLGSLARVVSNKVDERYGQVEIANGGAPVLLNARVRLGSAPFVKGDHVKVEEAAPGGAYYFVSHPDPSVEESKPNHL